MSSVIQEGNEESSVPRIHRDRKARGQTWSVGTRNLHSHLGTDSQLARLSLSLESKARQAASSKSVLSTAKLLYQK